MHPHTPRPGLREAWTCLKCNYREFGRQTGRPRCKHHGPMVRQRNKPYFGQPTE